MVKQGMAWAYIKYQTDTMFPQIELQDREQRVVLCVDLGNEKPLVAPRILGTN